MGNQTINPKRIGILGEKIAAIYLQSNGYRILDRNYSQKNLWGREIDIIAKKEDIVSFIEVKTLQETLLPYLPEEKVDLQKKRKLVKVAQTWLLKNKIPPDSKWQIDVISVRVDFRGGRAKIRHFKNAVSL